jgi:hypothetical protein
VGRVVDRRSGDLCHLALVRARRVGNELAVRTGTDRQGKLGHCPERYAAPRRHARRILSPVIVEDLVVDSAAFTERTGWDIKPEGACKGEVCAPLPDDARTADGRLDLRVVAPRLGMPIVTDEATGLTALGPETAVTGRALTTARAPELELPDADGNPFRLSTLLGQKVLLVAWASW